MSDKAPEIEGGGSDESFDVKEKAVHQHRNWVRITYYCNNRCIFCLDGDVPKSGHRRDEDVFADIAGGFKPGARLIISGGEASIHPSFIKFIEYGKSLGYDWIQTISNGRMYAYADFAKNAADAGLNEVTFSMHGHNSELHDELSGVEGAFKQALRGMLNFLKDGRVVVNVDCVINGLNYRHIPEILEFYMKLGIHEFDLLQVVPFGRAWWKENRGRLFYDMKEAFPSLNRAFRMSDPPENYIWTNRFPVAYLEGIEDLIQDPHKLYDELNGRRKEFDTFTRTGEKLDCHGERCHYCFIENYCASLYELYDRIESGGFSRLEIDLTEGEEPKLPEKIARAALETPISEWRLHARDLEQAERWLAASPELPGGASLRLDDWGSFLEIAEHGAAPDRLSGVKELVTGDPESIDGLASLPYGVEALLTSGTIDALNERREKLGRRKGFAVRLPSVETLTEARELLPDPRVFFEGWKGLPIAARGVPRCIHPNAEADAPAVRLSALDRSGVISMEDFTRDYIRFDYMAKSNRCRDCSELKRCPGLHINTLRVYGFGLLVAF